MAVAAHKLGRVLRAIFGIGKPRSLQGGFGVAALVQFTRSAILWQRAAIAHFTARLSRVTRLTDV
jgi:hypothetical protein